MEFLSELWLPILLSAVLVFVVSSILHMVVPIHKGDHDQLPSEDAVLAALREHGVKPGNYAFPRPGSMKEMASPEMMQKYTQGPVGLMVVRPNGPPAMGKSLVLWFLFSVVISLLSGYLAYAVRVPDMHYLTVFRVTGTVAIVGYAFSSVQESIWKGVKWSTTAKFLFDGVVYGLVTAGTFGWLWPGAA